MRERDEPAKKGRHAGQAVAVVEAVAARAAGHERAGDDQGWDRKDDAKADLPAVLRLRRSDRHVYRIARLAQEVGERLGGQQHIGADVDRVADVGREKVVQSVGGSPCYQRGKPIHDHRHRGDDPPQSQPDQVRDRQQQAKEDGQTRALQVVADDQLYGTVIHD